MPRGFFAALAVPLLLLSPELWAKSAPQEALSSVTIPVQEYLDLRKNKERTRVTSLEEASLSGTFGKRLTLSVSGRASGGYEPKEFLRIDARWSLHNCKGDALLDPEGSSLRLVPLTERFRLSCDVVPKSWTDLELEIKNVLAFNGKVEGAETLAEATGERSRRVVVTRRAGKESSGGEVTTIAKYRVTVQPEGSTFRYVFRFNNPNRGTKAFRLKWANGEIVQKVRGLAGFEETAKETTLQLSPGDSTIAVQGRFPAQGFQPPVSSEQQFLLVESSPTLQLAIEGAGRRITPQDADFPAPLANARLYTFGKGGSFTWTTRRLEVLEATGYSIGSAHYRYYVPEVGLPVVEARFQLENQGTPEVSLAVPGQPTYVEVNGAPQVLYKGEEGRLLVQVPTGSNSVTVQYRAQAPAGRLLAFQGVQLLKPDTVISNVNVELLTPPKWRVVLGSSLVGLGTDFDWGHVLAGMLLGLLLYGAGSFGRFSRNQQLALAGAGSILGFLAPSALGLFAGVACAAAVYRYRMAIVGMFRKRPLRVAALVVFVALPLAAIFAVTTASFLGKSRYAVSKMAQNQYDAAPMRNEMRKKSFGGRPQAAAPMESAMADEDVEGGSAPSGFADNNATLEEPNAAGFQGVPARISIPDNVNTTFFHQSMVDTASVMRLRAWLVSENVTSALALLCFALAGFLLYRGRKPFVAWTKATAATTGRGK